jgi:hypothetical protein
MKKEITIVDNALFAEFKKDCKVLTLAKEYPGYVGYEKYMILTDLSKEDLIRKYGTLLNNYEPYIVASMLLYSPIADYEKNEDKFEKRHVRNTVSIEVDSDDEQTFLSLQVEDYLTTSLDECCKEEIRRRVLSALRKLPDIQRRRLILWVENEQSLTKIAKIERVSIPTVYKSIECAKKNFKKYFGLGLKNGTPLSKEDEGTIDGE